MAASQGLVPLVLWVNHHQMPLPTYTVSLAHAAQHLIDVTLEVPAGLVPQKPGSAHELYLPIWTPGSYLVREYARHIQALCACDESGAFVAVAKVDKDRFRVDVPTGQGFKVTYRLYARELSVRTSYADDSFALVHPAATFLAVDGLEQMAHKVCLELPSQWHKAHCGLEVQQELPNSFCAQASDYDELIDSPWLVGNPRSQTFEVDGVPHTLAVVGGEDTVDIAALTASLATVVRTNSKMWGGLPYARYTFMHLALGSYGGLEHRQSAVTLNTPFAQLTAADSAAQLGLFAHEHFHVWNIKRLRPKVLGPFHYGKEALTTSLWIAEGLTAYYDDLIVRRSGLIDTVTYLNTVAKTISQVESCPGRFVQTLGQSSFDAWIKFYRPDENSANAQVSYYAKGALVGLLLDAHLRQTSGGKASLDDVMRLAYTRFSQAQGYTEPGFRQVIEEVAQTPCQDLLARAVDTTLPLDYSQMLELYGLSLLPKVDDDDGATGGGHLGARLQWEGGRLHVRQVLFEGPASLGGLSPGDELVAVDGWRTESAQWPTQLKLLAEGKSTALIVSRHGRLKALEVVCGPRPPQAWRLIPNKDASPEQLNARRAWLFEA